jgi:hypothetical protein
VRIGVKGSIFVLFGFTVFCLFYTKQLRFTFRFIVLIAVMVIVATVVFLIAFDVAVTNVSRGSLDLFKIISTVSFEDIFNVLKYTSQRAAGIDQIYLITDRIGSAVDYNRYFNPIQFLLRLYRDITPEFLYLSSGEYDNFSIGKLFYVFFANGDPSRILGMEPTLVGLFILNFNGFFGFLFFIVFAIIVIIFSSTIKNQFVFCYFSFNFFFLMINGMTEYFFKSLVLLLVFKILLNAFLLSPEKGRPGNQSFRLNRRARKSFYLG